MPRSAAPRVVAARGGGGFNVVLLVLGALVVIAFATAAYLFASKMQQQQQHISGPPLYPAATSWRSSFLLPSQQWNLFGRTSPTTPPLQDHLDRLVPNPLADAALAPNGLARLRAEAGMLLGGGYYDGPSAHAVRSILPTSVRPPHDKTYKQIGTIVRQRADGGDITNSDTDLLPLMGQWLHGDKWRYFAVTGSGTKLPVQRAAAAADGCGARRKGSSCTSEYGCGELYNDDVLAVSGFKDTFVANLWQNGTFYN